MNIVNYLLQPVCYDRYHFFSWQEYSLYQSLQAVEKNYTCCFTNSNNTPGTVGELTSETVDRINKSSVDIVVYLNCDHATTIPPRDDLLLQEIKKPLIIIDNDAHPKLAHRKNNTCIVYHIWFTLFAQLTLDNPLYRNVKREFLFSSLTNKVRVERILNIIEFLRADYYNNSLVTFNQLSPPWWGELDKAYIQENLNTQHPGIYEYFLNVIVPQLPINNKKDQIDLWVETKENIFNYDNPAHQNAYVNVVGESKYDCLFFSEKICKPCMADQMFVIMGAKNSVKTLESLGFDTYSDIINHEQYDMSESRMRVHDIHKLLNDIKNYDWDDIYVRTVQRRKHNRKQIIDRVVEKQFIKEFLNYLT